MDNPLVSALTFLLGLALGHWLAVGRDKRKEFNAAAEKFRATFFQPIQILRAGNQDVFTVITPAAISVQERALIEFERFLSKTQRAALKMAWSKYSIGPHTTSPGSLSSRPGDISVALANIEAILKFATPR